MVDDVVEDAAHRGGLVCLDLADDLQFGVVVGPLELVAEAGGGLHLEALADDRGEGFLVAGLLRAFGDDLGFGIAGEDHVVLVEEELGFGGAEGGDGAGVLGALGDDGGYFLGEQHLAGVECHDDGFLSDGWWRLVFVAEQGAHVCLGSFVGGLAGGVLCRVGHVRQLRRWVHERFEDVGVRLDLL